MDGNIAHIFDRIKAHKKAMGSTLSCGLARSHRGNIATAVKVEQIYGSPVLFSGMGSLVLSKHELNILDQHHKNHLQNLLKLHENTP